MCINVSDVLDHIGKSLVDQIDFYIDHAGKDRDELLNPFLKSDMFVAEAPYCDMTFEFEHAEFSLLQLCNMVEMLAGNAAEKIFSDELTAQVKEMVEGRIQRAADLERDFEQRKFNYEHDKAIERGEVA